MDLSNPPERFWHCSVQTPDEKRPDVVNDLAFEELERTVIKPWLSGRPFVVAGRIIRSPDGVTEIRIAHTPLPQQAYADRHNADMRASGIADMATDRRLLPFSEGEDVTFALLFDGYAEPEPTGDAVLVERVCRRLPQAARILGTRSRKDKLPFTVSDEYDVQDLLHATLRAYLKHSVQEDPIGKVAGTKSSRADVSIEDLGTLIEVKYVRGPDDQKRIFDEYSQDLVLYAQWPHLSTLLLLIYNSSDLRDAEALERLGGQQEVGGRRFEAKIILA